MKHNQRKKNVVVNGQQYDDLTQAAKAHLLDSKKVHERIRCGWTNDEALELVPRNTPSIQYKARKEAFAKHQGLTMRSIESRLSVRRNRFREWLHLPKHSPTNH